MIHSTKIEHAVKTQIYRWLNSFEHFFTASRKTNQLALLTDNFIITTPKGSIVGKENYAFSLADYKGMKIAHRIENVEVTPQSNGVISVVFSLIYHGVHRTGSDNCLRFKYETALSAQPNQLPLFKKIDLTVGGAFESPKFQDSYIKSRSLALLYYYLFLIEKLPDNADEFHEILTDDFQLNLSPTTTLSTIDALENWLKRVAKNIVITSHYPKNMEVTKLTHETYQLTVDFDWEGWTVKEEKMRTKTQHTWVINDKKNDRFAKIQSIEVDGWA